MQARPRRDPLRSTALLLLAAVGCSDAPLAPTTLEPVELAAPWETISPADAGLDYMRLREASARAGSLERMRSLLVVRHGRLVWERYFHGADAETLADVRSVTKSVVGSLTGVAIEEGAIESIDQPITDVLGPAGFPVRPEHAAITVGHLLTMSSGIEWSESGSVGYAEWITSDDHVGYLLARDLVADPGEAFTYNSAAVHLLGVVVEEATGESLPAFADRVLFGPLGIDARAWEGLPSGRVNGGAGLDLRPRDLARFGQLFLQGGRSGTRRILPEPWIERSMEGAVGDLGTVVAVGRVSYGMLWWIDLARGAAFAWGYGGQFVYVDPALDLVVVTTTEWRALSQDEGNAWLTGQVLSVLVDGVLPAVR